MSDAGEAPSRSEGGGTVRQPVVRRPVDRAASYPPIGDYALIGDCHSAALVSRAGSVDWCCMPRLDSDSCFGRLLDWQAGGCWSIAPVDADAQSTRRYRGDTLVLETQWRTEAGSISVLDLFAMRAGGREDPHAQLIRIVTGCAGEVEIAIEIDPRFNYGATRPWIRRHSETLFSAIGGDSALVLWSDCGLTADRLALHGRLTVRAGERRRAAMQWACPHRIHPAPPDEVSPAEIDHRADETIEWWERWASQARITVPQRGAILRSAIVLKGLTNAPTGAIAAAATTSLPEVIGGERNWDYRFSWVRDSAFALQSLLDIGFDKEALGFRNFIERTVAGNAGDLQVLYGLGGAHRLTEVTLESLDGYRHSRPVRLGNAAHAQLQLDIYGELLDLAWHAAIRGAPPDGEYWDLLLRIVETISRLWQQPDQGFWEVRSAPRHFVHSKVMCWAAIDRALRLAERYRLPAPAETWSALRDTMRATIERHGVDTQRGIFVRSFDSNDLDAALLLLPAVEFVAYDDERMIRTTAAIEQELGTPQGLLRRYRCDDGLGGKEGMFLACSFWLAECLARQGQHARARRIFDSTASAATDLGLFSEQYDAVNGVLLGNYPQALSHYSHIRAALALQECGAGPSHADGSER